jgi:hypothetical protein
MQLTVVGMNATEAVKTLSREFGVSERTVWQDWRSRDEWLPVVYKVQPQEQKKAIIEALVNLNQVRTCAYQCYLSAKKESTRISALRLALDVVVKEIQIRQGIGLVRTESFDVEERIIMIEGRFCRVTPDGKAIPFNPSRGHYEWREDPDRHSGGTACQLG